MWFNTIAELPYYDASLPCYCEPLALPQDLILQGSFNKYGNSYSFTATLLSPDGLTTYEDITSYFSIYYFNNPINGLHYFNARLNRFSPEMCLRKCWIIQVEIYTVDAVLFNKYTQRYCTATCCETATGVVFSQDGIDVPVGTGRPTDPTNSLFTDDCGEILVRLISRFPCYNNFTGEYYAIPDDIISGSADFAYTKITSIRGRFVPRPREITRQISYNCKLQRAESARQYLLEGYDIYPAWKMVEIENQLHAPYIWIETQYEYKEVQFTGGIVFGKVDGARDCTEYFKLSANLSDCIIRQTFGCDEGCSTTGYQGYAGFFIIPQSYNGGAIYDSNKQLIAEDIDGLLDWFHAFEGVIEVEILAAESGSPVVSPAISPLSCDYDYVIGIKTETSSVYIPTAIYYNSPIPANKIYSVTFDEISEVCDLIPVVNCAQPVLDYYTLEDIDCATPVLDYYTLEPIVAEDVEVIQYIPDGWAFVMSGSPATPENTSATVFNNQVTFSIKVRNDGYPMPEDGYEFSQTRIGVLGSNGRPQFDVILNSENSNLTGTQYVVIDAQGIIYYSGEPTSVSEGSYSEILLTDLTFNI